jgi:hypothetical protein
LEEAVKYSWIAFFVLLAAGIFCCQVAPGAAPSSGGAPAAADEGKPDPNFYVFLAFGQSNMEGYPNLQKLTAEDKDLSKYDHRFQNLAVVDFTTPARKKGEWSDALPPLCRPGTGLCPVDYFGRTLATNLPKEIKIGVVNVAVAGCKIEMFDKENFKAYASTQASWMQNIVKAYDGNPYQKLVDMGKLAQKKGVIKGILLHQGESNSGDKQWATKVKAIYDNLCKDLNLKPEDTPLLAGELTNGGGASMLAELPKILPNSYIISSKGCAPDAPSNTIHFAPAGYRELGCRYGEKMLPLLGYKGVIKRPEGAEPAASQPK